MKIPFWDATITYYRKMTTPDGSIEWKRNIATGCFWKGTARRDQINGAEFHTLSTVCRVPAPFPPIQPGDIIICGSVDDDIDEYAAGKRSTDILAKYKGKSMLVAEVRHSQRQMGIDHLYIGG